MHPIETLIKWLFISDIIWGAFVALWLIVAFPIAYLITRKRDKK